MTVYVGTKVVRGNPMTRAEYCKLRGWEVPADEHPADAGYLVEYLDGGRPNVDGHDGYISWSPKDIFERTYKAGGVMGFSQALELLRRGHAIARAGWNGKGMFVYLVAANAYPATSSIAKAYFGGEPVPYNAYMAIKGADGRVNTWAPSGSDCLADDWTAIELADVAELGAQIRRAA